MEKPHAHNGKPDTKKPLVIPVKFGTMTNGVRFVALPLTIARTDLNLEVAGETLCSRRLTGSILARPAGSGGQQEGIPGLDDDSDTLLESVFIVGNFTVSKGAIKTKLTFEIPSTAKERGKLFSFSGRCGLLTIAAAEDIAVEAERAAAAAG